MPDDSEWGLRLYVLYCMQSSRSSEPTYRALTSPHRWVTIKPLRRSSEPLTCARRFHLVPVFDPALWLSRYHTYAASWALIVDRRTTWAVPVSTWLLSTVFCAVDGFCQDCLKQSRWSRCFIVNQARLPVTNTIERPTIFTSTYNPDKPRNDNGGCATWKSLSTTLCSWLNCFVGRVQQTDLGIWIWFVLANINDTHWTGRQVIYS